MGRSNNSNQKPILNYILQEIENSSLKRILVLDLGMGYGNFGSLLKSNVNVEAIIDGVEIWEMYKTEKWNKFYDHIYIEEIYKHLQNSQKKYDFVLLIDVLEHFDKNKGKEILDLIIKLINKALIISTPTTEYPQGNLHGNPYEEHKCVWSDKEIKEYGFEKIDESIVPANKEQTIFATLGVYVYKK